MIAIADLLRGDFAQYECESEPDANPFEEQGALQEAQLIGVAIDTIRSIAALLFDLRTALQLREANTGLLIIGAMTEVRWSAARAEGRTAWTVLEARRNSRTESVELDFELWPTSGLTIKGADAVFFTGDVRDLGRIPDYVGDSDDVIQTLVPGWNSAFNPLQSVRFKG